MKKNLKTKTNLYKRQGLEFSHISEINITFLARLHQLTCKHYTEQPMPMVERLIKRKLYENYELIKTLHDMDLTSHMGTYEKGRRDVSDSTDGDG